MWRAAEAKKRNTAAGMDSAPNGAGENTRGAAWGECGDHHHRRMRRYGLAMFGVGSAAVAYHLAPLTKRKTRVALRQLDFTSIALASAVASDAYGCQLPTAVKVASLVAAPRFPLLVSGLHCAASEVAFFNQARRRRKGGKGSDDGGSWGGSDGCKRAHTAHMASVLGAAFFFTAEELWPEAPFFHATWHCLGAAAIATGNQVIMGRARIG